MSGRHIFTSRLQVSLGNLLKYYSKCANPIFALDFVNLNRDDEKSSNQPEQTLLFEDTKVLRVSTVVGEKVK